MNSKVSADFLLGFAGDFVHNFGQLVEKSLIMALSGVTIPCVETERRQMLDELLVRSVASVEETLGHSWAKTREQKNGQDAFERRASPARQDIIPSNESLGAVFSVMTQCLDMCPLFVAQVSVTKGIYSGNDLLLRRVIDAAVESLYGCDPDTTAKAICFLSSLVRHEML